MPRTLSMVLFLVIGSLIVGSIHYYIWARLVRDPRLPWIWYRGLTLAIVVLGSSIPLSFLLMRTMPREMAGLFLKPTYIWMGVMFLLLVAVGVTDLVRTGHYLFERLVSKEADPARRLALSRLLGFGAAALGLGASSLAIREGYRYRVKRVEVPLERLPPQLDGTSIAQISDLHVGPGIGRDFVQTVVNQVNQLQADVVAITGDLVDGSVEQLAEHVAPLKQLKSRYGTFFVTGNHEYYSGVDAWCRKLA